MRRALAIARLGTLALILVGCGGSAAAPGGPSPASGAAPAPLSSRAVTSAATKAGGKVVEIAFHYPVGVSGPLAKIINGMAEQFNKEATDVKVTPVFDGDYQQTLAKVQQLVQAKTPPETAILNAAAIYTLLDMDAILPLDDLVAKSGGDSYVKDFLPAFLANSQQQGKTWSIPFQRSTFVMYYNKDAFKEAGLDPEKPPQTWDELVETAKKLTRKEGGTVTRWGVGYPSDGSNYWEFQALAIQAGQNVFDNNAGNKVFFNAPASVEALQFLVDLSRKYEVMPGGALAWATLPTEFAAGKYSIMFHSTGSLTNVLKTAKFPVGVAFNPKKQQFGSPTGGGNFYIFKGLTPEKTDAAWKFVQWMTTPERLAQWTIDTGYVAPRKSAYETPLLKAYVEKTPQVLVARDQLQYAQNELGTHQMAEVQTILSNAVQAAVTGQAAPKAALDKAQAEAEKILSQYKN